MAIFSRHYYYNLLSKMQQKVSGMVVILIFELLNWSKNPTGGPGGGLWTISPNIT